jgi:hypothetical protein
MLSGAAFSKVVKDKSSSEYDSALEDLREDFNFSDNDTYGAEEKIQKIIKERDSKRAKYNLLKGLIVFTTSVLVGSGLRQLEQNMISKSTEDFIKTTKTNNDVTKEVAGSKIDSVKIIEDNNIPPEPIRDFSKIPDPDYRTSPGQPIGNFNESPETSGEPVVITEAQPQPETQPDPGRSIRRTFRNRDMFSRSPIRR